MKVKCEYCGSMIDDKAEKCPNCGAPNANLKRTVDHTPKTIEELKKWYEARHLPPYEVTRFFIGIDYKEPKAFGIYEKAGEFIVYKNKADGTRAIRYQGDDEAYAVNEIYLKLKSEILNQKARNQSGRNRRVRVSSGTGGMFKWGLVAIVALLGFFALIMNPVAVLIVIAAGIAAVIAARIILKKKGGEFGKWTGRLPYLFLAYLLVASIIIGQVTPADSKASYYSYGDSVYAEYDNSFYLYDPYIYNYIPVDNYSVPEEIVSQPEDYEFDAENINWDSDYKFEDSEYYEQNLKPDDSYSYTYDDDSDWDWDSDDTWDSGGTDWDSDW